ncbi:MAG: SRPBCC domain-containing protein [Rhizobiales bacterium]|nr:SRPBCC domain-containing protein [Hyphomicrobiales bacterium]
MNAQPEATTCRDVSLTRIFDAPIQLVWMAWTDPGHMAQWWGPKGFTNPVCEIGVRQGGAIRIHMRAPDGAVYPMTGTFEEISPPERLVFTSVARDDEGNPLLEARTTVAFEDVGGKTKVTIHSSAVGIAPVAPQMLAGMEMGWTQSLEKLADLVERR